MTEPVVWWLGMWPLSGGAAWWATSTTAGPDEDPLWGLVPGEQLEPLLAELDDGLPQLLPHELLLPPIVRDQHAVHRAWTGALARPRAEQDLALALGKLLLPDALREQLLSSGRRDNPDVTLVIAPGPTLARVPWELLAVDRGLRLLECARIRGGLSPVALHGRALQPRSSDKGHVLRVVDPGPAGKRLYGLQARLAWKAATQKGDVLPPRGEVNRQSLSALLKGEPRRLLYVGHAGSGPPDQPSAAHLVINEKEKEKGNMFTAAEWLRDPVRWPMPRRVAIIACHSNDTQHAEQMGLVLAAVHAGAELITCTRWSLPDDNSDPERPASRPLTQADPPRIGATTDLAFAVDAAHDSADPVGHLRRWQLQRLDAWRDCPSTAHAPLVWAAPVTYLAPPEIPDTAQPLGDEVQC